MMRTARLCLWIVLPMISLGCMSNGRSSDADGANARRGLMARKRTPVLDIPVPIGFEIDTKRSFDTSGAGIRFIEHVYTGRADRFDVRRFYERNMETHGWRLMSQGLARGPITLTFDKQVAGHNEECKVIIDDAGPWDKVEVRVSVKPRGPMTVPAAGR